MRENDVNDVSLNKLVLVKNLHICETALGIIGAGSMSLINPTNEIIGSILAMGGFVLSAILFYHGLNGIQSTKEDIIEAKRKIMLKDLEN